MHLATRASICNIKVDFKSSLNISVSLPSKSGGSSSSLQEHSQAMEPSRHLLPGHQHRLSSTDARQTQGSFVCLRTLKAKASIVCQHRQSWFILVPGRRVLFSQIPLFRSRIHCSSFHFTGQADPVKYVTSYNGRIRKHPRELSDLRKQLLPPNRVKDTKVQTLFMEPHI